MKKYQFLVIALFFLGLGAGRAQFTVLHSFNDTLGAEPTGDLTYSSGLFYGMTTNGGANNNGCVFSIDTTGGGYKDIFDFNGVNGEDPVGNLTVYSNKLYGMTTTGGVKDSGCIFSIDMNGNGYKDLHDFNMGNRNGYLSYGSLFLLEGKLYGMTRYGGKYDSGSIFSIDTNGNNYKDLFDFNSVNGYYPQEGTLILSGNRFYGMTFEGGINGIGVVFSIDTNGSLYTHLLDFDGVNGSFPHGSLALSSGRLYGMTYTGGANSRGCVFALNVDGTGYKDLLDFNVGNGYNPFGSLIISENKLYGMTPFGGALHDFGSVFSIDTDGIGYKAMLFFNGPNGSTPYGNLVFIGRGLYGMTSYGGTYNNGVIFKIDSSSIAAINNLKLNAESIDLYPNPNNGQFTIALSHAELVSASQTITIYNVLGEQVYDATLKQVQGDNSINISNQPNGIYLYRVLSDEGGLVGEGKLIIQK